MQEYRVIYADSLGGLAAVAGASFKILQNTVREFDVLTSDHDPAMNGTGTINVQKHGWVALARLES
jgi:hypothetical protein